jgi:hypothetical protein
MLPASGQEAVRKILPAQHPCTTTARWRVTFSIALKYKLLKLPYNESCAHRQLSALISGYSTLQMVQSRVLAGLSVLVLT